MPPTIASAIAVANANSFAISTFAAVPEIPSANQMADWSAPQFIQVSLGFAMLALSAIAISFIRQMAENAKDLNRQHDAMLAEMMKRYDKQDQRYELLDIRHQARDEKTIETLRVGLADMSNAIRDLAKGVGGR